MHTAFTTVNPNSSEVLQLKNQMQTINDNIRTAAAAHHAHTGKEVANLINMPVQTYYDRLRDPSKWRLDELLTVCKRCRINLAWLEETHDTVM